MKINKKVKVVGIGALLVIGIVSILIWRSISPKQEISKLKLNQASEEMTGKLSTLPLSNTKPNSRSVSNSINQLSENKAGETESPGKTVKSIVPTTEPSQTIVSSKQESPAELLQRYLKVTNSPEFEEEGRRIIEPLEVETYPSLREIKKLEDKEKELKQALEGASDENRSRIQNELEQVKSNLWETRVESFEKIVLLADAVHKVHLKFFSNEEIRIAREEMWKTVPRPLGVYNDETKEISKIATREAIRRLKAKGWVPANPDEKWYVN